MRKIMPLIWEEVPAESGDSARGDAEKSTGGIYALVTVSPELAAIVGDRPITRTEIMKRIWEYIRDRQLQDPENRWNVRADELLLPIFGKDVVTMFEMTKLVAKHITGTTGQVSKRRKTNPKPKSKPAAKSAGKPAKPVSLINATQSALLKARLDRVCKAHEKKLGGSPAFDDNATDEGRFLAQAIRDGALRFRPDALGVLTDLFEKFVDDLSPTSAHRISVDVWNCPWENLFVPEDVQPVLEKFAAQSKQRQKHEYLARKELARHRDKIARALAAGTTTGAEVTAMLDEFEAMSFAEVSDGEVS